MRIGLRVGSIGLAAFVVGAPAGLLNAQSDQADLRFAKASIHLSKAQGFQTIRELETPGGQFIATGVTIRYVIARAYPQLSVSPSGGPHWLDDVPFDIAAVLPRSLKPASSTRSEEEPTPVTLMLRRLLAERFKLAVHVETR